jgi:ankyrin repeat protein
MDVVRKLLLHDTVDVNCQARNGRAALSMACDARSHDVVRELLKHNKMHVNCRDGPGDTALTMACKPNNVHFVWELVDRDDGSGLFKLVYRRVENLNMIREVLEHDKVDVNAKDHGGRTALYWASYSGLWGAIEILLQYDEVDVNAKGAHGNTALVWACLKGRLDIVCKLLKDGRVDTSIRNKAGSTALDVARNLELIEITSCLEEHDKSCLRRKPEVKIAQEDVLNWKE